MLNRAARYFPILREIQPFVDFQNGRQVLEVGSGSIGLGQFWSHQFVGCDVTFAEPPQTPMHGIRCSGTNLPFADQSFDVVVVSDVIEHVPPRLRGAVVCESLRVARKVAVFGYPYGPLAHAADRRLREQYVRCGMNPPVWLEEHMLHPFPEGEPFSELPQGWKIKSIANESLGFHYRMMRLEMHRQLERVFRLALRLSPGLTERFLQRMDREPSYRKIFVLSRQ